MLLGIPFRPAAHLRTTLPAMSQPQPTPESFPVTLIAAVGSNLALGKNNALLWSLPADMAHFRSATRGAAVIMGRKTWESLPEQFRPLPGRTNIVATRRNGYPAHGAILAHSLEEALHAAKSLAVPVFVIGGAEIYAQAMPFAERLILTEVEDAPSGADAFFPAIDPSQWTLSERIRGADADPASGKPAFSFATYLLAGKGADSAR